MIDSENNFVKYWAFAPFDLSFLITHVFLSYWYADKPVISIIYNADKPMISITYDADKPMIYIVYDADKPMISVVYDADKPVISIVCDADKPMISIVYAVFGNVIIQHHNYAMTL